MLLRCGRAEVEARFGGHLLFEIFQAAVARLKVQKQHRKIGVTQHTQERQRGDFLSRNINDDGPAGYRIHVRKESRRSSEPSFLLAEQWVKGCRKHLNIAYDPRTWLRDLTFEE